MKHLGNWIVRAALGLALSAMPVPLHADPGPNFRADYTFSGNTISQFAQLGGARWSAGNGVIKGVAPSGTDGWLMLDRPMSNAAFFSNFKCAADCKAGVLLRAEKTLSGWKGIFVSLSANDLNSYEVTLDTTGRLISRQKLGTSFTEPNGAEGGLANAMGNVSAEQRARAAKAPPRITTLPDGIHMPDLEVIPYTYKSDGWNPVNILVYREMLNPSLGSGGFSRRQPLVKSVAPATAGKFGPIALYVGAGTVEYKDVATQDLNTITLPEEHLSANYRMNHMNGYYFSWSTAVADFDHDGNPDVMAGPYYYSGPDFKVAHEIYEPHPWNQGSDYPMTSMVSLAYDFTGDGWPDVLVMSGSAGTGIGTLYVNPQGRSEHWDSYVVIDPVGNEDTLLADIDGDGKPEIIHAQANRLVYTRPNWANPTQPWTTMIVSEPGPWGAGIGHGLGVGDINGDGRKDFINAYGWWEQPEKIDGKTPWKYHPATFGRWGSTAGGAGGAQIEVYDVNGDGLPDVVGSLEGHDFGLAWFEQKRSPDGEISFVQHTIMDGFLDQNAGGVTFTEPHATAFADMNGDGILDMIVGKRTMSHLYDYGDPDPFGPAVLYVYTVVRDKAAPGGARFVPELVHNMSGVGSHIVVTDLDGDGIPDITTSGVYGTFAFINKTPQVKRRK